MSNYRYSEPQENEYEPLPEGDYHFTVHAVEPTYSNARGTFIVPVEIRLEGTNRKIKQWLSAGTSIKGKPFDMIAPFLKCVDRNPVVGGEPNFSSRHLVGATGEAAVREEPYSGENPKYKGKSFPTVVAWIYERSEMPETSMDQRPAPEETDDIPF